MIHQNVYITTILPVRISVHYKTTQKLHTIKAHGQQN